jgi:hypothetical protein
MTDPPEDDDLPDIPKRSLRDLIRFEEWQIKKERTSTELRAQLRAEIEKLFTARTWPSIVDILGAFRVYAQGLFDVDAEFLLEEERDTVLEYEARLLREAEDLHHIFGRIVRGSSDGGKTFSDGTVIGSLYKEIISDALDLRTRAKLTTGDWDWRFEGFFPDFEHPQDFYLSMDISRDVQGVLTDRIHHWAAEFQSRRGPLVRLTSIDAEGSTIATQKTGADGSEQVKGLAPAKKRGRTAGPGETAENRASRRQAVVMPILEAKGWTRGKLVTDSAVGKATVYGYLDGTRKTIIRDNRKALAEALGITLDKLPR